MARIPTILSESGLQGNYNPGFASPSAFANDSMGQLSNALGQVAGASVSIGNSIQRNRDRDARNTLKKVQHQGDMAEFWKRDKLEKENERWSADKLRIRKDYSDFTSSDEFAKAEGKAQAAFEWLQKSRQNFGKDVSKETASRIGGWFDTFAAGEYERLSGVDASERLERNVTLVDEYITSASDASVAESVNFTNDGIEFVNETFSDNPALKSYYLAALIENQIAINPEIGGQVLESTKGIDAVTRKALRAKVDEVSADRMRADVVRFRKDIENRFDAAEYKDEPLYIPTEDAYVRMLGEVGRIQYEEDLARMNVHNASLDATRIVRAIRPDVAIEEAKAIIAKKGFDEKTEPMAIAAVEKRLEKLAKMAEENGPGWVLQGHPEIERKLYSGDEADKLEAFDLIKQYQAKPPAGETRPELYLWRGDLQIGLLSNEGAKTHVESIKAGTAKEAADYMRGLFDPARFPESEHNYIAGDLVRNGLPEAYTALLPFVNEPVYDKMVAVIHNPSEKIDPELREAVLTNEGYENFSKGFLDPWGNRTSILQNGYDELVVRLADGYMREGKDMKSAVDRAVSSIVNDGPFGVTTVNGKSVVISRDFMPGGRSQRISIDKVERLGEQLDLAIQDVDPSMLSDVQFAPLVGGPLDHPERIQAAYSKINKDGVWLASPDGRSMVLHVKDDVGYFEVMSKLGQPIRVWLSEIPDYTRDTFSGTVDQLPNPDPQAYEYDRPRWDRLSMPDDINVSKLAFPKRWFEPGGMDTREGVDMRIPLGWLPNVPMPVPLTGPLHYKSKFPKEGAGGYITYDK